MKQLMLMLVLTGVMISSASSQSSLKSQSIKNVKSNSIMSTQDLKTQTKKFINAVNSRNTDVVREMVAENYIQHNPFIPTGRESFLSLFPVLDKFGTRAETVRIFEDGNYVVMHNIWKNADPFGANKMVSFDVLRYDENGKIAEHWDGLTSMVKETASGRTQTDGTVAITDLDKTEANKATAKAMVEDILMGKNPNKIVDYISSETYHQHNPDIKDGLSGIVEAVQYLTSQNNMFKYTKIHKVLGEGNFVLTISEGEWGGSTKVFYDLLRFENGKAVEHWDVIQDIPTENLANENTMFNF